MPSAPFLGRIRVMCVAVAVVTAFGSLAFAQEPAALDTAVPTCSNALTNLGFESGNFTGWTTVDHPQPFLPMAVRTGGFSPGFGLFATAPTDGTRVMSNGFDGGSPAPSTIRLYQTLAVPKARLNLQFDYRAGWDMLTFGGSSLPRVFSVDIEPPAGGTPLQTTTILTAPPNSRNLDTGSQRGTVSLANFQGQSVRVSFEWLIPQISTGPAHFQLDNVMPLLPVRASVDGNGVFEPGETVSFRPGWLNCSTVVKATTGTATVFTGPSGPTYTMPDPAANYGNIPAGGSLDCTTAANCYSLAVSAPASRPAVHWDATLTERLSQPGLKDWTVHIGGSFTDLATTSPFYRFVETLLHHGVTGGCGADTYCPLSSTTRDQMAVFVLVAKEGAGYTPVACTIPAFPDVPATSPFCRFIEELARRGVVAGCGGGNYCPTAEVTREQMAVFVLRTLDPALNPPACTTPVFGDVPASNPFCRWIEELARRGVVSGCGGGNYCPSSPVTREQMGVFIGSTFSLTLYGP